MAARGRTARISHPNSPRGRKINNLTPNGFPRK